MSLSRISPSGDGISEQEHLAVKHNKCQSREAAGLRFTARFRNAVGAAARDSDFKLGWIDPAQELRSRADLLLLIDPPGVRLGLPAELRAPPPGGSGML